MADKGVREGSDRQTAVLGEVSGTTRPIGVLCRKLDSLSRVGLRTLWLEAGTFNLPQSLWVASGLGTLLGR